MAWRTGLAALLLLAGAYTAIGFSVDQWEGRLCWIQGTAEYMRLPLLTALRGAAGDLVARLERSPFWGLVELAALSAFLWPVAAVMISTRAVTWVIAASLVLAPFALFIHGQMRFGVEQFCNDDGIAALGMFALMLFVMLPAGAMLAFAAAAGRGRL